MVYMSDRLLDLEDAAAAAGCNIGARRQWIYQKGEPGGHYTNSRLNKQYAADALAAIRQRPMPITSATVDLQGEALSGCSLSYSACPNGPNRRKLLLRNTASFIDGVGVLNDYSFSHSGTNEYRKSLSNMIHSRV